MRSFVAVAIVLSISLFTLPIYYFGIPDTLKLQDVEGMQSPVTADFNWCEKDYVYSEYIAEIQNTVTSVTVMLFAPIFFWSAHKKVIDRLPKSAQTEIILQVLSGIFVSIGSGLFHATLWYVLQLWDEIGIYFVLIAAGSCSVPTSFKFPIIIIGILNILGLLLTIGDRYGVAHQFFRGCMTCSYAILSVMEVVFVFEMLKRAKRRGTKCSRDISFIGDSAFCILVFGIICWIVENLYCELLPRWLELHAFGWHTGATVTLYAIPLMLLYDYAVQIESAEEFKKDRNESRLTIRWFASVIPILAFIPREKDE